MELLTQSYLATKRAFTGATANRSGYFEVADGGTIF
ncbi:MAG: hypothetical protein CM15mP102_10390 [Flavobacteriales bacterium]|nr:MAG: hypothetical protein CM15mP102_10390 [Flavobacteriales bacterium]